MRIPGAGAALALAFAVLVWPAVLLERGRTSEAADQAAVHLPVIREMERTWPAVDVSRYDSATGPGYHLAMAAVARTVSADVRVLRITGSLFALGLLLATWRTAARLTGDARAGALTLPLLASPYFLGSAIWLTTDDAALAFAALATGGALTVPPSPGRVGRWGLWAAAAVFVRQVHAWTVVPVALAARAVVSVRGGPVAAAAVLAPLAVLAFLVSRWGGPVQPQFAGFHAGVNPAALVLTLALCGAYGPFFLPAAGVGGRGVLQPDRTALVAAAGAFGLWLVLPSSYDMDAGRWAGPAWRVLGRTLVVAERSVPLGILAVAGAVVLVRLGSAAVAAGRRREVRFLAVSGAAWLAAHCLNAQAFQRYAEPPVLIGLAWLAALSPPPSRRAAAGPALLALLLLAGSVATLYRPVLAAAP